MGAWEVGLEVKGAERSRLIPTHSSSPVRVKVWSVQDFGPARAEPESIRTALALAGHLLKLLHFVGRCLVIHSHSPRFGIPPTCLETPGAWVWALQPL